jgi:hypothetical protein
MAIFPKTEEKPKHKGTLAGPKALLLGAVLGLVVGGAGVLAFMRTPKPAPEFPPISRPTDTVVSNQFSAQPTVMLTPAEPDWMTRAIKGALTTPSIKGATTGLQPNSQSAPQSAPLRNVEPPASMPGGLVTSGPPPGNMSLAPVKPPPPPISSEVQLVKLDVYDGNPVLDAGTVESFAKSLGASVRQLSDFKDSEGREADALLILIPEDKLPALVKYIEEKQPNILDSSWQGDADARQSRLFDEPQRQLDVMERKRKELLLKFLEDATPVKVVDEAIAKLKTTIARMKIEPKHEKLAAVKVTYRPKS